MKMVGYRYRFCKDAKSEWIYSDGAQCALLGIMLDHKDADETFIETLKRIFTKCNNSKLAASISKQRSAELDFRLAASICKQRCDELRCLDSKSERLILELFDNELKSSSHLPELGNFEIEQVEVEFPEILFDNGVVSYKIDECLYFIDKLGCIDKLGGLYELGYLNFLDSSLIKVISQPKATKTRDLISS